MRFPVRGEQIAKAQLEQEADLQRRKQQRAQRRSRSRWGWVIDPWNISLVLVGAVLAIVLAHHFGLI